MSPSTSAQQQQGDESTIIYETWFDFISETPLFTNPQRRQKQAKEEWFIRERTIIIEPEEHSEIRAIFYRGRSAFVTVPYFRAEIISKMPTRFDAPGIRFVLGIGPDEESENKERGEGSELVVLPFLEPANNPPPGSEKSRLIVRYTENLHFIGAGSPASIYDPRRLPVLYVRKAFPEDGAAPPDHIIFHVNVPLGVYHILPPPFEDRIARVSNEKCRNQLLAEKLSWHALVFKRNADQGGFFDVDCEESLNVIPYFVRYLMPEGVWKLSLIVHRPKRGRVYGIHLPVPLTAFEP